tara:strand:+ start:758 stop:2257 length:1500 start_codon:yes stop_codon:yes gene_type:complete
MARLIAGPWVGEFGVELMRWQAYVRTAAKQSKWDEVIVATRESNFFLYEDFATKLLATKPPSIHFSGRGCRNYRSDVWPFDFDLRDGDLHLDPFMPHEAWQAHEKRLLVESTFIDYSKMVDAPRDQFDVLVHARSTLKANQVFKNWPISAWEEWLSGLPSDVRVASVGAKGGASHLSGTADLRGLSLRELAGHCGVARLMVGPSSGPLHFAMLCGQAVVGWCMGEGSFGPKRNPFNVPVCMLPGWAPHPEIVSARTRQMLQLTDTASCPFIAFTHAGSQYRDFLHWALGIDESTQFTILHDCRDTVHWEKPPPAHVSLSQNLLPWEINDPWVPSPIETINSLGRKKQKVPVIIGQTPENIALITQRHGGSRPIIIIDDLGGSLMRLRSHDRFMCRRSPRSQIYSNLYENYASYIGESTSRNLLPRDTLFVSLHQCRTSERYRTMIISELHQDKNLHHSSAPFRADIAAMNGPHFRHWKFADTENYRRLLHLDQEFHQLK